MTSATITCVGALLICGEAVLLGRRAAHKSYAGCWDLLGGHVEAGESFDAALARELSEEIGVAPLEWRLLSRCRFEEDDNWADLVIYAVDSWSGEPTLTNDEHSELRWIPLAEASRLDGLAAEEYRAIFQRLLDGD